MQALRSILLIVFLPLISGKVWAQSACSMAGIGSADPNVLLRWTLTTGTNTPCLKQIVGQSNWINVGQHVVVRPKHGTISFPDGVHFFYVPTRNFSGRDSFEIMRDRRIAETGEISHRRISFDVNILGAGTDATTASALPKRNSRLQPLDAYRRCIAAVNAHHPIMEGPMRGYMDETAYNTYMLDLDKCLRLRRE